MDWVKILCRDARMDGQITPLQTRERAPRADTCAIVTAIAPKVCKYFRFAVSSRRASRL